MDLYSEFESPHDKAADFSQSEQPNREQEEFLEVFCDLVSEITFFNFLLIDFLFNLIDCTDQLWST